MRRYVQLYALYVVGFIPVVAIAAGFEGAMYGRHGLGVRGWSYTLASFARDDAPWLVKSGIVAAAILCVLLNRLAAKQPARYVLLAAGAGVVAIIGAEGVLDTLSPLAHSDAWQVSRMLLALPGSVVIAGLVYGLAAVVLVYGESFPFDALFRWQQRLAFVEMWLTRPIGPATKARIWREKLGVARCGWHPTELSAVYRVDDWSDDWLVFKTGLSRVITWISRKETAFLRGDPIDAAAGDEVFEWLDRCEELLAGEFRAVLVVEDTQKVRRFLRKSRGIAEVFLKMSGASTYEGEP